VDTNPEHQVARMHIDVGTPVADDRLSHRHAKSVRRDLDLHDGPRQRIEQARQRGGHSASFPDQAVVVIIRSRHTTPPALCDCHSYRGVR